MLPAGVGWLGTGLWVSVSAQLAAVSAKAVASIAPTTRTVRTRPLRLPLIDGTFPLLRELVGKRGCRWRPHLPNNMASTTGSAKRVKSTLGSWRGGLMFANRPGHERSPRAQNNRHPVHRDGHAPVIPAWLVTGAG